MSKDLDFKIKEHLALIAKKEEEIKLIEKPKYITNSVIEIDGVSYNFNVITLDQMAKLAYKIAKIDEERRMGYDLIGLTEESGYKIEETEIKGFKVSEWLEDLVAAAKRKNVKVQKDSLAAARKELEKLYSEDTKRENKVDDILGKLNL